MSKQIEKIVQTRWLYALALALGLMQACVFDFAPQSSLSWLAAVLSEVSLAGFLLLLMSLTPRRARRFGYIFGLGVFAWGLNWVYISMSTFGGAPLFFALGANILVVLYLSLYWLAIAFFIMKLGKTPNQRLLLAPAVIALVEWLRSFFLIGFPWLSIGYGFVDNVLGQCAAYVGVFGVSFLAVWLVVILLLDVSKYLRAVLLAVTLCCVAVMEYLPSITPDSAKSASAKVSLVQGNMPVITRYDNQRMMKNTLQYQKLTKELLRVEQPDVIIWSESAIPFFYVEVGGFLEEMLHLQQEQHFDFITGIARVDWRTKAAYNAIFLQTQRQEQQFYDKVHLLPFGEYLPFRSLFAFFERFVSIPRADFSRGTAVQAPFRAGGLVFSPSICFEAVFGNEIRRSAQHAQVLLNISNDAWFGRSKAQAQHVNIARMRAIENRKPLVRATNDGRTVFVDSRGRITHSLPPFTAGTLTAVVTASNVRTGYAIWGDKLVLGLSVIMILAIYLPIKRRRYD